MEALQLVATARPLRGGSRVVRVESEQDDVEMEVRSYGSCCPSLGCGDDETAATSSSSVSSSSAVTSGAGGTSSAGGMAGAGGVGTSWTAQMSGTSEWLWSVYFLNAQIGWAVGSGGTIIKTAGGGSD